MEHIHKKTEQQPPCRSELPIIEGISRSNEILSSCSNNTTQYTFSPEFKYNPYDYSVNKFSHLNILPSSRFENSQYLNDLDVSSVLFQKHTGVDQSPKIKSPIENNLTNNDGTASSIKNYFPIDVISCTRPIYNNDVIRPNLIVTRNNSIIGNNPLLDSSYSYKEKNNSILIDTDQHLPYLYLQDDYNNTHLKFPSICNIQHQYTSPNIIENSSVGIQNLICTESKHNSESITQLSCITENDALSNNIQDDNDDHFVNNTQRTTHLNSNQDLSELLNTMPKNHSFAVSYPEYNDSSIMTPVNTLYKHLNLPDLQLQSRTLPKKPVLLLDANAPEFEPNSCSYPLVCNPTSNDYAVSDMQSVFYDVNVNVAHVPIKDNTYLTNSHNNYLYIDWKPVTLHLPFYPNYATWEGNNLLIGGTNLQLCILNEFNLQHISLSYDNSSNTHSTDPSKTVWIHLETKDETDIIGVSQIGVHIAKFQSKEFSNANIMAYESIPIPHESRDRVTAVGSIVNLFLNYGLGTETGYIHWLNLETSQIISSITPSSLPPVTGVSDALDSNKCWFPDSYTCGITRDSYQSSEWPISVDIDTTIQRLPVVFGTLGGNIILTDNTTNLMIQRLHVFDGPIIGIAQCNWDLIILGITTHLSQQDRLKLLQGHINLIHYLRIMVIEQNWDTQLGIIDIRMLRSLPYTLNNQSIFKNELIIKQQGDVSFTPHSVASQQLIDIKHHPQISQGILGLCGNGHILSIEVAQTKKLIIRGIISETLPEYSTADYVPLQFDVSPIQPLNSGLILIDSGGHIFCSTCEHVSHRDPYLFTQEDQSYARSPVSDAILTNQEHSIETNNISVSKDQDIHYDNHIKYYPIQDLEMIDTDLTDNDVSIQKDLNVSFYDPSLTISPNSDYYVNSSPIGLSKPSDISSNSFLPPASSSSSTSYNKLFFLPSQLPENNLSNSSMVLSTIPPFLWIWKIGFFSLSVIEEFNSKRPPQQYRFIPASTALESIKEIRYKYRSCKEGVEFHPLIEAFLQRDIELIGIHGASEINSLSKVDSMNNPSSHIINTTDQISLLQKLDHQQYTDEDRTLVHSTCPKSYASSNNDCHTAEWLTYLNMSDLKSLLYQPEGVLALFNRSGLAGLEPSARYPMVNAVVQVLRFIPQFENHLVRHHCEKETCLACELGLLWHMLALSRQEKKGRPCQAKNFMSAFDKIPEVRLCHILPYDKDIGISGTPNELETTVQVFLSFLFQHLRRELSDNHLKQSFKSGTTDRLSSSTMNDADNTQNKNPNEVNCHLENIVDYLFGCSVKTTSTCLFKGHETTADPVTRFVIHLLPNQDNHLSYEGKSFKNMDSFVSSLKRSLERKFTRTSFCKSCNETRRLAHQEKITHLPPVLAIDCLQYFRLNEGIKSSYSSDQSSSVQLPLVFWIQHTLSDAELNITIIKPQCLKGWRQYDLMASTFVVKERINIPLEIQHSCLQHNDVALHQSLEFNPLSSNKNQDVFSHQFTPDHLVAHIRVPKSHICHHLHQRQKITHCFSNNSTILGQSKSSQHSAQTIPTRIQSSCPESCDNANEINMESPPTGNKCIAPCRHHSNPLLPSLNELSFSELESNIEDAFDNCLICKNKDQRSFLTSNSDHHDKVWVTFNDFIITLATEEEVLIPSNSWKSLSCLFYVCHTIIDVSVSLEQEIPCPIPTSVVLKNTNLSRHPLAASIPHFTPLTLNEIHSMIFTGGLLALDAEFVLLNRTPDLRDDSLALARISVIRGNGLLAGVPCLDCHILTKEEPLDYLTQFSGLNPGDLDETHSIHWLTTKKAMYQKLRFFVDHHCAFVGHGLSKDFHIANLFVPESQLIDTAKLYRLPGRRILSLRFLANHVLHKDIQCWKEGHDSIEDATVALELYKHYQEIELKGEVLSLLNYLYDIGSKTNWTTLQPLIPSVYYTHDKLIDTTSGDTEQINPLQNINEFIPNTPFE